MSREFHIGEIARFFDLPASTLRYWDQMGMISPVKDTQNHYRRYQLQDFITISDTIFYKNLGLSIRQILDIEKTTPQEHKLLFTEKLSDLKQQQKLLEKQMQRLHQHLDTLQVLEQLQETPYQRTDIDTDCIVSFDLNEQEKLLRYIENPYLYSRVQHSSNPTEEQRGLTLPSDSLSEQSNAQIIWKKHSNTYVSFLMREEVLPHFPNDLAMHLTNIQKEYTTGDIISRFLLRAQEDEKTYDYYKTFVEIIDS